MNRRLLLQQLSDGEFHSGQKLSKLLKVSRTTIWTQLQKLAESGYEIYSVRGRGYRVYGGIDLLETKQILAYAALPNIPVPEILDIVDSTNEYLLRQTASPLGTTVFAEEQTHGRGQRARPWDSPLATNLYFSIFWLFNKLPNDLMGLSLVVAIAVARALRQYGIQDVRLKWPNDIFYHRTKLGGILLESRVKDKQTHMVIGVGLNVNMTKSNKIDQAWNSVKIIVGKTVNRNQLAGWILKELYQILPIFERDGFTAFHQEWQQLDVFKDHEVEVECKQQKIYGTSLGVDEKGNLLIKRLETISSYNSSEVKVRLL